jgi:hypothetical protein
MGLRAITRLEVSRHTEQTGSTHIKVRYGEIPYRSATPPAPPLQTLKQLSISCKEDGSSSSCFIYSGAR